MVILNHPNKYSITLPETDNSHLKRDGWNTIISFWDGLFLGGKIAT